MRRRTTNLIWHVVRPDGVLMAACLYLEDAVALADSRLDEGTVVERSDGIRVWRVGDDRRIDDEQVAKVVLRRLTAKS
jgi:hypothetical protein